jgi:DDE family transposase
LTAIDASHRVFDSAGVRACFLIDREGDSRALLLKLLGSGADFIVRSAYDRRLQSESADRRYLRAVLGATRPLGSYRLAVAAGPHRAARQARMQLHVARVCLRLCDERTKRSTAVTVTAVWARERGTTPRGETPIDWLLLTNQPVANLADAKRIAHGYSQRWRIEEFHKTWKSGACQVESTQLRKEHAVRVWATLQAAVATRIERLKYLARHEPDQPATVELSHDEIRAVILLKREYKSRTEHVPDTLPTIGLATRWIADLGGYTGKSSGGPPRNHHHRPRARTRPHRRRNPTGFAQAKKKSDQ